MNAKKVNRTFLFVVLFYAASIVILNVFASQIHMSMVTALLVSQGTVLIPVLLSLIVTKTKLKGFIPCKKIRISTALLIVVVTYLCMPLIILANAISMLFVENEVSNMMADMGGVSPLIIILIVGILGPANEEFVFRGVIYHGYRGSGRVIGAAVLSSVLFGIMHLNFNQMPYAIIVGLIGVLLIESTGSILSSIIFHATINTSNTILAYCQGSIGKNSQELQEAAEVMAGMSYKESLCIAIALYMVIAVFTTAIAGCLIYVIARNEKRTEHMKALVEICKEKNKTKLFSVSLWFAIFLCSAYMIFTEIIGHIAG